MWQCSACKKNFHELCAGYEEGSLADDLHLQGRSEGVTLHVQVYCDRCLDDLEFEPSDVSRRVVEIVAGGLKKGLNGII